MLNDKQKEKIIKDLLRARPLGPNHPYKKLTYTKVATGEDKWSEEQGCYIDKYRLEPSEERWGYSDETLFMLGFVSRSDVESHILESQFPGIDKYDLGRKRATLTRRTNRLWNRIKQSISRIKTKGSSGVYKVDGRWDWTIGYIFADNMDEATTSAKLYFGYLVDDAYSYTYPKVTFVSFGSMADIKELNDQLIQETTGQIKAQQQRIEEITADIKQKEFAMSTAMMVLAQQQKVEK